VNRLLAASFLCCCFCSIACLADDKADTYLLIRVNEVHNEAIARIDLTHVDTGSIVRIRSNTCNKGSVSSRICLVPAPAGRYFWTRFDMVYLLRGAQSRVEGPGIRRTTPESPSDSVEIVAGAINYIGDWQLDNIAQSHRHSHRPDYSVGIRQDPKALQEFYEHFPDEAAGYEIYLSMRGKKAISLRDFLKLVEQQTEDD
jgi:hypothetical protein